MKKTLVLIALLLLPVLIRANYVVVVSEATSAKPKWKKVASTLKKKYAAKMLVFENSPTEILLELKRAFPRYTCFVCQPEEVNRGFVRAVHQLTRRLDEDPFTDTVWGILTGHDAANALQIARTREPLIIKRTASGTEVELERCHEGIWYCELRENHAVQKKSGKNPVTMQVTSDTTRLLVDTLNDFKAQLFVTSGHATERDWQIGFRYRNGSFRSENGQLYGRDLKGKRYPVNSPNPKVYMPIGNCLMGHIDGQDAMALAFLKSAGVRQMLGYIEPTWYGYAGWGVLDYFVEQPGRHNFSGAFFANQHALIHRLQTNFPKLLHWQSEQPPTRQACERSPMARDAGLGPTDGRGLLFDRDVVVFYGDPAWEARMMPGKLNWEQTLKEEKPGNFTFTVKPKQGKDSFKPVNTNGSQRGWRPIIQYFPNRLKGIEVLEGSKWKPVIVDDFLLLPLPRRNWNFRESIVVKFRATRI